MAMSSYDLFDREDYILFHLEYIQIRSKLFGKRKIVQNYVVQSLQTCVADKLEQEEKCDGRNCFVLYNILKFFLRR